MFQHIKLKIWDKSEFETKMWNYEAKKLIFWVSISKLSEVNLTFWNNKDKSKIWDTTNEFLR